MAIRQREARQIIAAAKQAGAKDVTVKIGEVSLKINLAADDKPVEELEEQIKL
jgi:hypothetical protein